jgi:hypothetical protein
VPSTQNVFVLMAETEIGENDVGTADPGLGYTVGTTGAAGATLGAADDGGDARALDAATTGDEGDSLTRTGDGTGDADRGPKAGVRLLAVAVDP